MKDLNLQSEKIGERLKAVRNKLNCTVEEFYSPLMKSFNNGSSLENNKRKLGRRLAKDIIDYYGINPQFLSTGRGEMFQRNRSRHHTTPPVTPPPTNTTTVPYYSISIAELAQQLPADIFRDSDPEYYVDYRPLNDCTAYLPVYGNSMYPLFTSGEIIAVKTVSNPEIILWGEAYLIVTDEQANNMITIRQLHEHHDPEKIILRASNPEYKGDTVIHRRSINKLYLIKGKITRYQL